MWTWIRIFIDTGQATFLKAAIPISYSEKSCIKIEVFFFFSGDVFVGRRGKDKNDYRMNMFGHFIIKAVFLQLIEDYPIKNPETKVQCI